MVLFATENFKTERIHVSRCLSITDLHFHKKFGFLTVFGPKRWPPIRWKWRLAAFWPPDSPSLGLCATQRRTTLSASGSPTIPTLWQTTTGWNRILPLTSVSTRWSSPTRCVGECRKLMKRKLKSWSSRGMESWPLPALQSLPGFTTQWPIWRRKHLASCGMMFASRWNIIK